MQLTKLVPFMLEAKLKELGAVYERAMIGAPTFASMAIKNETILRLPLKVTQCLLNQKTIIDGRKLVFVIGKSSIP
jgi:hypothetical protein